MDTDRLASFVTTVIVFGVLAFVVVPNFGYEAMQERLWLSVAVAVTAGVPIAFVVNYVWEGETYMFGPWDLEDLVFILAFVPLMGSWVWIAEQFGSGAIYWILVAAGFALSAFGALVVRDATVGEWPPGSKERRERRDEPQDDL